MLEVASPNTWQEDEGPKRELYERLGVREYFQHDPMGGLLPSRLQGRRLVRGAYEPLPAVPSLDGGLLLYSETLELDLLVDRSRKLRFRDPVTGEFLLGPEEAEAARRTAEAARHGRKPPAGRPNPVPRRPRRLASRNRPPASGRRPRAGRPNPVPKRPRRRAGGRKRGSRS